jgi:hypothetical protein
MPSHAAPITSRSSPRSLTTSLCLHMLFQPVRNASTLVDSRSLSLRITTRLCHHVLFTSV